METTFQFSDTPWEKDFYQLDQEHDVFVQKGLDIETKIYRYTSLDTLLHILSRSEYYISKRILFTDKNERGVFRNLKYGFDKSPVGGNAPDYCEAYQEYVREQKNAAMQSFVTCWTEKETECYLMWKSYASNGVGVRIETTIDQLLKSLQSNPVKICCTRVDYKPEGYKDTWFKKVFVKKPEYEQEQEVRICVCPNRNNQIYCDRLMLKVNTPFITSVTLSPFLSVLEQKFLVESLNKSYPNLVIKRSLLVEKC